MRWVTGRTTELRALLRAGAEPKAITVRHRAQASSALLSREDRDRIRERRFRVMVGPLLARASEADRASKVALITDLLSALRWQVSGVKRRSIIACVAVTNMSARVTMTPRAADP